MRPGRSRHLIFTVSSPQPVKTITIPEPYVNDVRLGNFLWLVFRLFRHPSIKAYGKLRVYFPPAAGLPAVRRGRLAVWSSSRIPALLSFSSGVRFLLVIGKPSLILEYILQLGDWVYTDWGRDSFFYFLCRRLTLVSWCSNKSGIPSKLPAALASSSAGRYI